MTKTSLLEKTMRDNAMYGIYVDYAVSVLSK